jgi:hypothetical protein
MRRSARTVDQPRLTGDRARSLGKKLPPRSNIAFEAGPTRRVAIDKLLELNPIETKEIIMKSNKNSSSASNSSSGQMPSKRSETSLPIAVQATLEDLRRKLNLPAVGRILRETLTSQEAKRIKVDLVRDRKIAEPSALQMWSHLRGCEGKQELVDLALRLDFITFGQHQQLQESLGSIGKLPHNEKRAPQKPSWDERAGELRYDGKCIRKVKSGSKYRILLLLRAFEGQGWPRTIDSPPELPYRDVVSSLVHSLNQHLSTIKFSCRTVQGRTIVSWGFTSDLPWTTNESSPVSG